METTCVHQWMNREIVKYYSSIKKGGSSALTGVARLGVIPQSERSPVHFPVRACAWVGVRVRGNQLMFLSLAHQHFSPFLSL